MLPHQHFGSTKSVARANHIVPALTKISAFLWLDDVLERTMSLIPRMVNLHLMLPRGHFSHRAETSDESIYFSLFHPKEILYWKVYLGPNDWSFLAIHHKLKCSFISALQSSFALHSMLTSLWKNISHTETDACPYVMFLCVCCVNACTQIKWVLAHKSLCHNKMCCY